MKALTTFKVELEGDNGDAPVVFTFRIPRLNELQRDRKTVAGMAKAEKDGDDASKVIMQMELIEAIIARCISVTGITDENGVALGTECVADLPITLLEALMTAYNTGSAEAMGRGKKEPETLSESKSA